MNKALTKAIKYWKYIQPIMAYPCNEKEFDQLVSRLDELLDIVGENENDPLMGLIDIMSHLIETYESIHYSESSNEKNNCTGTGINALKFLMDSHQLKQSDLPEIGSQGVISEILNQKRTLNLRQIKLLAQRFHVSPATFLD